MNMQTNGSWYLDSDTLVESAVTQTRAVLCAITAAVLKGSKGSTINVLRHTPDWT
jgi:hypothetical protein